MNSLYSYFIYIPHNPQNTPNSHRKKAQCRKTKWKRKIGQYLKEDAVLCKSISTYKSMVGYLLAR